jgi:hypothetical protein
MRALLWIALAAGLSGCAQLRENERRYIERYGPVDVGAELEARHRAFQAWQWQTDALRKRGWEEDYWP